MSTIRNTLTALAITSALALTACSAGQDSSTPAANQAAAASTSPSVVPLTADQVNVQMTLQGAPVVSADAKSIAVTVDLANHGKTTLSSAGGINLGAHSADVNGKVVDMDLARAPLPDIAPNSQATVTIQLPTDKTLGNSALILPVQEGVDWFDTWGTKPLVVGPFSACANPAVGKVCNADGTPLASATN